MPKANTWMSALTQWNNSNSGAWCIPKRGSDEYKSVKAIQMKIKSKKHHKRFREAAFGSQAPTKQASSKKKRRIRDDSDADEEDEDLRQRSEYAVLVDYVLDNLIEPGVTKLTISPKLKSHERKIVLYQQLEKEQGLDSKTRLQRAMKFDGALRPGKSSIDEYLEKKVDSQWKDMQAIKKMIDSGKVSQVSTVNKHNMALKVMFRAEQIRFLNRL